MLECNGSAIPVSENSELSSFFSDCRTYPAVPADGKILTKPFLDASKTIVKLFELQGAALAPVKYDVSGNIEKLEKKYNIDPERFKYINDMIKIEMEEKQTRFAIDSLLWLKRALEYTREFLQCIVDDREKTENLTPFCKKAYEKTLSPYHGWVVKKFCNLAFRACPWRKDLMKLFSNGREGTDDFVISEIEQFLSQMNPNLNLIIKMYDEWGLNSDVKNGV